MLSAVNNLGFLNATITQKKTFKKKKVKLVFEVSPGPRYKVRHIDYRIEDSIVRRIVNENSSLTLLQSGIPFDLNVLDAERGRISNRLQNSGYYKFNKEYIRYEADTCVGNHEVDLKVLIPLYRASANEAPEMHRRYMINRVAFSGGASFAGFAYGHGIFGQNGLQGATYLLQAEVVLSALPYLRTTT